MIIYDYLKNVEKEEVNEEEIKYYYALQKKNLNAINSRQCLGMLKTLLYKKELSPNDKLNLKRLSVILTRVLKVDCKVLLRRVKEWILI